jgi:chaperonin GroES
VLKLNKQGRIEASLRTKLMGEFMQVKPLQDRVLIERVEEETKTAGGIIIPDNNKEKPAQGKVVSVGTGYRNQDGSTSALEVKAGDVVLFGKYSGTEVKVEGKDFIIMKEDEILGVMA